MLDQFKEVMEEMTNRVVEFMETSMDMVENNLGPVPGGEAWCNMVEEFFSGDEPTALQVICSNPKLLTAARTIPITITHTVIYQGDHLYVHHRPPPSRTSPSTPSTPIFDNVSKVVGGAILLLISLAVYTAAVFLAGYLAGYLFLAVYLAGNFNVNLSSC